MSRPLLLQSRPQSCTGSSIPARSATGGRQEGCDGAETRRCRGRPTTGWPRQRRRRRTAARGGRSGRRPRDGRDGRAPRGGRAPRDGRAGGAGGGAQTRGRAGGDGRRGRVVKRRAATAPDRRRHATTAAGRDEGSGRGRRGRRRATARMDPPQRAADRGRRRRIHDGQGLLLPSRERIDDGRRQTAPDGGKKIG